MKVINVLTTIDTHTEGGPTRIISSGLPLLHGETMMEKMNYFKENLDRFRKILMHEPRGHQGMFGAVITEPTDLQADIGVFFLTHSGYLNMCVHSAIGVATACLETGIILKKRNENQIKLDTPAGIISLQANYEADRLTSISLQTNPAFVHTDEASLDVGYEKSLKISLVFSAVFFALLDLTQIGMRVSKDTITELISLGIKVLDFANQSFEVQHPENPDLKTIDLALLYEDADRLRACNAVVSGAGSLDRSPCGAGTGAKMTYLFVQDKLKLGEEYVNKSVYGTEFRGKLLRATKVGPYQGAIPQITGSAYITGFHKFILDRDDPLKTGL